MHSRARVPRQPSPQPVMLSPDRIGTTSHLLIFAAAFLLLTSRRPDAVLHAQFWAEDGTVFYANAYNAGWHSLVMAYGGYLNLVSQMVGLLALLVPLRLAPLLMNFCALAIQALPVNLLLSRRFSAIPLALRGVAGFCYVGIPNAFEVHANITNVQWTLGFFALLILVADAPRSKIGRACDVAVLVLLSLDGPLGVLLTPFAAVLAWKQRDRWSRWRAIALVPGSCAQAIVVLSHSRAIGPTGASVPRLVDILVRQIFAPSLVGLSTVRQHVQLLRLPWEVVIVSAAVVLVGYALWRGPLQMKIVISFSGTVLAAALARPLVTLTRPQWEVMAIAPGAANRYYFLPEIAFLTALAWIASNADCDYWARGAAIALLAVLPYGMARDWRNPSFPDLHFRAQVRNFNAAPRGATVVIPINPPGWTMTLSKH